MVNQLAKAVFCSLAAILLLSTCVLGACSSSAGPVVSSPVPSPTPTQTRANPTPQPSPAGTDYVEVVYFHRTQRCYSCRYAGDATERTVETYFARELATGKLVFKMVDVQNKANAAIVKRYGAYGSSLYMNKVVGGVDHIQQVTQIWYRIGKDDAFVELVKGEIERHLGSI